MIEIFRDTNQKPIEQFDWLVFSAHPDDAEIGMGGTISKFAAQGVKIAMCDLTQAECSSNGDVITRESESIQAAQLLGVQARYQLQLPDRGLRVSADQLSKLTEIIRTLRPRIVFAPFSVDRHPDHVQSAEMVREAVFNARLRKVDPHWPAWKIERLWHYTIHQLMEPQWVVDVSDFYSTKQKALSCYQSQFAQHFAVDSVPTPINQRFLEQIEAKDRLNGARINRTYGEAFITQEAIELQAFD